MGKKIIMTVIAIGVLGILSVALLKKPQAPASKTPIVANDIENNATEVKDNNMPIVPENNKQPIDEKQVVKEFTMESFVEFVDGQPKPQFSLKEIMVNKGDKVKIKITNIKGTHDFKLDEFNIYVGTPL